MPEAADRIPPRPVSRTVIRIEWYDFVPIPIGSDGRPELHVTRREMERCWHDANHLEIRSVNLQHLADRIRRSNEPALPEAVTQDGHAFAPGHFIGRRPPANHWRDSHQREEIRSDKPALHRFRFSDARQCNARPAAVPEINGDIFEGPAL